MSRLSQSPLEHLAALERTVALPVVAGDCYDWCRSVNREAIELDRVLQEWAEDHAEVYEEIRAQAMALESRVELLEADNNNVPALLALASVYDAQGEEEAMMQILEHAAHFARLRLHVIRKIGAVHQQVAALRLQQAAGADEDVAIRADAR